MFWLKHHDVVQRWWERFGALHAAHQGTSSPPARSACWCSFRIGDTRRRPRAVGRPRRVLEVPRPLRLVARVPLARRPPRAGRLIPTLEECLDNRTWLVGTAEDVAEGIDAYRHELGGLSELCLFPNMPGDPYELTGEQLARYAEEVRPLLG